MSDALGIVSDALGIGRAAAPLRGRVAVPGSKSLSTRALVLAAISPRPVLLRDLLASDDTRHLASAIGAMGARLSRLLGHDWMVDGRELPSDGRRVSIDLGDGGAPTRFAMALALLRRGETLIDGSARMRERPITDGVRLLRTLGAEIEFVEAPDRLPIRVQGGRRGAPGGASAPVLDVGRTASSQFISAVMLTAPAMPAGVTLRFVDAPTSASYLALTIEALRLFGAEVRGSARAAGDEVTIRAGLSPPAEIAIPADASSAVVWTAAAAMVPGSRIELPGVRRDGQPDLAAIDAIGSMGASLEWRDDGLVVSHRPLRGIDVDAGGWPDGALAVAATATTARAPTRLRSLGTLRVKESDRLAALEEELRRLGAGARIDGDDLLIDPVADDASRRPGSTGASAGVPAPVTVDPRRDHRLAMAFALIGLVRGGVTIREPSCVAKSYPGFWRDLASLAGTAPAAV